MLRRGIGLLVLLAVIGLVAANDELKFGPDVLSLTESTFDDIVNGEELMLIAFTAPWCGHCKQLKPAYSEAATELKKHGIKLANVDCTKEKQLQSRFEVSGFPTMKIFRYGRPSEYKGLRSKDAIVTYMKKQVGPAAKPITSRKDLDSYIDSTAGLGHVTVGFFPAGSHQSQLKSAFMMVSEKLRGGLPVANIILNPDEAASVYGLPQGTTEALAVYTSTKQPPTIYSGSTKTKEVEEWVTTTATPIVGEYNEATADVYTEKKLPILKMFMAVDWQQATQMRYFVNRLKKVAEEHKGKLLVTVINGADFPNEAAYYGYKDPKDPVIAIEDPVINNNYNSRKKYRMEEKFGLPAMQKFARDYFAGILEPHIRSEREPSDNTGPVKIVTGKSFNSFMDENSDVMIEFYAPWCGHCRALEPKYNELGEELKKLYGDGNNNANQNESTSGTKGSGKIKLGKLDATANDFDRSSYEVSGYPTIYFKPAQGKPMKYTGNREVTDMLKFIQENAKTITAA